MIGKAKHKAVSTKPNYYALFLIIEVEFLVTMVAILTILALLLSERFGIMHTEALDDAVSTEDSVHLLPSNNADSSTDPIPSSGEETSQQQADGSFAQQPTVAYSAFVDDVWQDAVENGAGCPTDEGSPTSSLAGISITLDAGTKQNGSLRYSVADAEGNQSDWKTSGEELYYANAAAIRVELEGDLAENYDVWYRTYLVNNGWLGWTSNGSPSGGKGQNVTASSFCVKIVSKEEEPPGPTSDPYVVLSTEPAENQEPEQASEQLSGDDELDAQLVSIIDNSVGRDSDALQKAYEYVSRYSYVKQNENPEGDWRVWSVSYAKEMIQAKMGNCYRYASLFCWLAKALGYDARVVCGLAPMPSGLAPHGWVEVRDESGGYVVCDPDMHMYKPEENFFMVPYDQTPFIYYHMDGTKYTNEDSLSA